MGMAETLVEKLRARAEWWEKLEDYVVAQRDEARGTQWFARFNSIAHSIRGRIAVEEEAADTIIGLARRGAAAGDLLEALKGLYERYVLAIGNEGPEAMQARFLIERFEGQTASTQEKGNG